jgi:RNA polymerase sigma-70 factor (ECF subfamily)
VRFASADRTMRPAVINGEPGFIVYVSGTPIAAVIFHVSGGRIRTIYSVANPDKLAGVADRR